MLLDLRQGKPAAAMKRTQGISDEETRQIEGRYGEFHLRARNVARYEDWNQHALGNVPFEQIRNQ